MRFVTPKKRFVIVALSLVLAAIATAPAANADEYQPQTPVGRMMQGLNPANWKMPGLTTFMPAKEDKDRIIKRKDGLVSDVKETATRSWTKTKETLNPMRLLPTSLFGSTATPASTTADAPAGTPIQKAGFFSSLMGNSEKEVQQTSSSVDDFLRQNKPVR
ncbi:hypothetical protein [Planctomycetes bacterium K23_9]|uniref:Uncharacterized protein n=1 Tax=Stieleria marina TaxID=1930275 RepID=A0A517NNI5_9BACT|nr:hypothetical protein K239x_06250 [Planctomycetes bacterium K23_9]